MKKQMAAAAVMMAACAAHAGGFYVGGQVGTMSVKDWTGDRAKNAADFWGGSATSNSDTQTGSARVFAGYNINHIVGIELGYLQSGEAKGNISGKVGTGQSYRSDLTIRTQGFDLSAIVHPFESSQGTAAAPQGLYVRAGVSQYETKFDASRVPGSFLYWTSGSKSGMGTLVGLGYDWKLGPGALRLDATFHQSMADLTNNDSTALSVGYVYAF